jgi:hypothetical protein
MDKRKQYVSLAIVFWGATNFSQVSLAQYNVPMQPPVPRHDTMFPKRDRKRSIPSTSTSPKQEIPVTRSRSLEGLSNKNIAFCRSLSSLMESGSAPIDMPYIVWTKFYVQTGCPDELFP